jgi:AraC-like DNA-binding protein
MGISGPKHPLIAIVDFSKTSFSGDIPINKVICNFYQIAYKSQKSGSLKYGRETYDYQEGSLVYIEPEQVVDYQYKENTEINEGWSLFFHPDLIRTFPIWERFKEYNFFKYQVNEALHISSKERDLIESILDQIEIELDSNIDDFSEEIIVDNLQLLLNYSKRFYNRQFITRKRFDSCIMSQFSQLLEQYFEDKLQLELGTPKVQYFADKLNLSPNYLSDLIRKASSKSILEHIHYHIIELAKHMLLNSNRTVSEIAYELGFEYPQYFSRLFKNKIGQTALEYRNLN